MNNENSEYQGTGLEIAVIGMAGRFPGANNIDEFWENLKNGTGCIHFFSEEELTGEGILHQYFESPNYVKAKGYLEDIEYFDATFFGMKAGEAEAMDPQLRVFIQCAWHALEHAGYNPLQYPGLIGLYTGGAPHNDWELLIDVNRGFDEAEAFALGQMANKDYLATAASYKLNLKGPSYTIDTACSTSLVALHLACQALLSGECDIALAGGVSANIPAKSGYIYSPGLIYSPDGYCRSFDARANGTVFGNGVGVVVLKALEDAIDDGDFIHAVIKGSAINNDGNRKVGFTATSAKGQAEVIRMAYDAAQVNPETIGYIETHGTGTSHGDPIEIKALNLAFGSDKKQWCPIGSVKASVGHLYEASGVTSLIKTVLILKHRLIPPSLHYETANPEIDFDSTPFYVNTRLTPGKTTQFPFRAGVSSFGVGGTNAHVILEEWPQQGRQKTEDRKQVKDEREDQLILLSAKTQSALESMTENLADYLKKNPHIELADTAYTLRVGREPLPYRSMLVSSHVQEAVTALSEPGDSRLETFNAQNTNPPVVFMFPGQGSQYVNMGRELYDTEPLFRKEIDRCSEIIEPLMSCDIKEILYPGDLASKVSEESRVCEEIPGELNRSNMSNGSYNTHTSPINQTEITQPVLFIIEYALAKLLMYWGIKPDFMIGHSIGEYVAACLSGVFSLEDALELVSYRGKLMQQVPPGKMLSVKLTPQQISDLLVDRDEVELAAINSSSLCVLSGPARAIDEFAGLLKEKGCQCRILHTSHAFHSRAMDPILEAFKEKAAQIKHNPPTLPYISNRDGSVITSEKPITSQYWVNHLRNTVRFADGLTGLLKEPETIFLEIGPGNTLCTFVRQHRSIKAQHKILNLIPHPGEHVSHYGYLLNKLGQLWIYGKIPDWEAFHGEREFFRVPLPPYPFERQRYWKYVENRFNNATAGAAAGNSRGISDWFYTPFWKQKRADHASRETEEIQEKMVWLVFMDSIGFGPGLLEHLDQQGQEVIVVKSGKEFDRQSLHQYVINPLQPDDYRTLFNEISRGRGSRVLHHILHLGGITGTVDKGSENGANSYFYYLVWLVQALEKEGFNHPLQITVLSDHMHNVTGQEELQPHKSLLLGPVRAISWEYPYITCRSIDILPGPPGSKEEEIVVNQVWEECVTTGSEPVLAFRNGLRWVPGYEPVKLEKTIIEESPLGEKGVWLISGGFGNIGMMLANQLAAAVKARLVLVGRSQFPEENQWQEWLDHHEENDSTSIKIRQLQELKQLGAEVLVCSADVSSRQQMQQVINRVDRHFGTLNGVIHAAGTLDYTSFLPIIKINREECQKQFKAKIEGLLVLDELLQGRKLDLCLLTSSLVSISGGKGCSTYAAAHLFIDVYAQMHHRTKNQQWLSVNLDARQQKQPDIKTNEQKKRLDVLSRVLSWRGGNQLVISIDDLYLRLIQWKAFESPSTGAEKNESLTLSKGTAGERRPRPHLSTPYVESQTPLEQKFVKISQEFLGIDPVGIHDNFFELGASSLDLVQLGEKYNKILETEVPITELFRYPTIHSLAKYLTDEHLQEKQIKEQKEERRIEEMTKGRQSLQDRMRLLKE